jgi:seryl-tRNA synthetase
MSYILNLKKSTMLDLELYFPEEEMDKVLCCAKNCSDFRAISVLTS